MPFSLLRACLVFAPCIRFYFIGNLRVSASCLPIFAIFIFLFCFVSSFKVAVNTVVPRSPFSAFCTPTDCFKHKMKYDRISASMQWRYLGHLQFLSTVKHSLTAMAKKEVCPRDEIADPPGTANIPIDRHGFTEGLVPFRTLCGVQSSLVRFAPNRAITWGPPQS